jgi:hypothetical protein
MALFLLVLLGGGLYLRATRGRALPRVTQHWDAKRRRNVTKGRFEVALYALSPGLWRAWSIALDLVGAGALAVGVIACLRMSVTG